jgi:hypothetical protein
LIGNPYPSAIDADTFIRDNLGTPNGGNNPNGNIINGTLYFWNHFAINSHQSGDYQGGYAMYTLMGGTEAINNDVKINSQENLHATIPQRHIPVGQGFFVSTKLDNDLEASNNAGITKPVVGGNVLFKNSQRLFKKENEYHSNDNRKKIRILFTSPNGYHRQLLVGVDENASNKFDIGYDGPLIENNKEDAFWVLDNTKLIIQAINNFNDAQILPIGTKISKSGLATFKMDSLENISNNLDIFLYDSELNVLHNLRENDYTINLSSGEIINRFELSFKNSGELPPEETDNNNEDDDIQDTDNNTQEENQDDGFFDEATEREAESSNKNLKIYYSNQIESIVIENSTSENIHSVNLFNILGQSIYNLESNMNNPYIELKIKSLNTGTYILKLQSETMTITKKVLVN